MSERKLGILLSYVAMAINIIIALFYTPILVGQLGVSAFGLYSLAIAFLAYFVILDFGLMDSVVRYVVKHRYEGGDAAARAFLGRILPIYGLIIAVLVGCGAAASRALPLLFGESFAAEQLSEFERLYWIAVLGAAAVLLANPFSATLVAYERFTFQRTLEIVSAIAVAAISTVLLFCGAGASEILLVMAASLIIIGALKVGYVLLRLGLWPRFSCMPRLELREICLYVLPIFVAIAVEAIYWRIDNVLIGSMLGPAALAIFAIGVTFQKHLMRLSTSISKVMVSDMLRRLEANAPGEELALAMARIARYQALVLSFVMIGLGAFGDQFLELWLGPEFAEAYWVMMLVLAPFCIDQVGNLRNSILQVRGLYWRKSGVTLVIALFNVVATIVLIPIFGVLGAAASTGVALLIGYAATLLLLGRCAGFPLSVFFSALLPGVVPTFAMGLALAVLINVSAAPGWAGLFAMAGAYAVGFAIISWVVGFTAAERGEIAGLAAKLGKRLTISTA